MSPGRWTLKLPRRLAASPATLVVGYPLGLARYRLRVALVPSRHRRS